MKVLVVDDDPHILESLAAGFELQWQDCEVVTATDGEAGLQAFYDHNPDVIILDVAMPYKGGLEALREIRRISDVPVIMLSARGEEADQVRGLELGADDYVVKPYGHLNLVARIRAVLRRADMPSPSDTQPDFVAGDLAVSFSGHRVTVRGEPVTLTPMEFKLLTLLVRNAGRLMPHRALLDRAWGEDDGATTEHLKVFISRLRRKLEREGTPPLIETERGIGYRFVRARPSTPAPQGSTGDRARDG